MWNSGVDGKEYTDSHSDPKKALILTERERAYPESVVSLYYFFFFLNVCT